MKTDEIYRRAIEVYGPAHQMLKAKEECAEFLVATMQYEQDRVPIDVVVEELADVIITSQQARLILGHKLVDDAIQRKLDRLVENMETITMVRKKWRN